MKPFLKLIGLASVAAAVLAACGGGGGSSTTAGGGSVSGASANATSSGAITAFGSVFVNGHEFDTHSATVVDDDTGATAAATGANLEVGMAVDVKAAGDSSSAQPRAAEIHVHPLARGYVDAVDTTAGTVTVMGQLIQTSPTTLVVDRRACVTASSSPCTAKAGVADLSATSGGTPGTYVGVHGFLLSAASPSAPTVVATLLVVGDAPSGASPSAALFKAEGVVSAVSGTTLTIGGLTVDLASATCFATGATACNGAFAVGDVVSAFSGVAPSLPATSLMASKARLRKKIDVESPDATVELEGRVTSVSGSTFVLRGVTVDASGLSGGSTLPALGDEVRVLGTLSSDGTQITATSVQVMHAAAAVAYGFETTLADADVAPGSTAGTFVLQVLGQSVTVDASTRLADASASRATLMSNPFNISTFQSYLAASASKHVLIRASANGAGGALTARAITILPIRNVFAVAGRVDATPAPANATGSPALTTFAVHGVPVSADPAAVLNGRHGSTTAVAAGDAVLVRGTWDGTTLNVAAPSSPSPNEFQIVIDAGSGHRDDDLF